MDERVECSLGSTKCQRRVNTEVNIHDRQEILSEPHIIRPRAMALGHPLGATGAKLLCTLLNELERRHKRLKISVNSNCCSLIEYDSWQSDIPIKYNISH